MAIPVSETYSADSDMKLFDDTYTDFASADRDQARNRAYSIVNSVLINKVTVPLKRNSSDDYDGFVKSMESLYALHYLYAGQYREKSEAFRDDADRIRDDFLENKLVLEEQMTSPEIGVQQAVKDDSNSGSGNVYVDQRSAYTDTRRRVYTITITTGGAVGTAVYSYQSDLDTSATTGQTTSNNYTSIGYGIRFYFSGNEATSFSAGDVWTITAIPETEQQAGRKMRSVPLIKCG